MDDFKTLIKKAGIKPSDTVLLHSEIFQLGIPFSSAKEYLQTLSDTIVCAIGDTGTLILPTYTYSFCKGKIYNPSTSFSKMGALNEFIRKNVATHRTLDANFSHALLGKNANRLMCANSQNTFGKDGIFAMFKALNGKVLLLGSPKIGGTFFHHVEKMANVSYRFDKEFKGILEIDKKKTEYSNIFFARRLDMPSIARAHDFIKRSLKSYKSVKIKGFVAVSYSAREYFEKIIKKLKKDEKFFL